MQQTGVDLPTTTNGPQKKEERNQLLEVTPPRNYNDERTSFVPDSPTRDSGTKFSLFTNSGGEDGINITTDEYRNSSPTSSAFANYVAENRDSVSSTSSGTPPPRMGESDCFSKFQNAFVLQQTLASLRSSHSQLHTSGNEKVAVAVGSEPPKPKNCTDKLSDFINHLQESYNRAIGRYNDPYYDKKIDPSKLQQLAASSVRAAEEHEVQGLNPNHIPVEESELNDDDNNTGNEEEEDTFANIYQEFPAHRMTNDVI